MAKLIATDAETSVSKNTEQRQLPNDEHGREVYEQITTGYTVNVNISFQTAGDMSEFDTNLPNFVSALLLKKLREVELSECNHIWGARHESNRHGSPIIPYCTLCGTTENAPAF